MQKKAPPEFSKEAIEAASDDADTPYRDFVNSREPYRSLLKANPWIRTPKANEQLVWGEGKYYDTTVARKHPYWKDFSLPKPEQDIAKLRKDIHQWGYCLIKDALSAQQNHVIYQRVVAQAQAEREMGIAQ